jgi:YggT family protein
MTEVKLQPQQDLNLHEQERGIAAANQNSATARVVKIVYFLFGTLELLLLVRVILRLIGANAENGFASLITSLTAPFVTLFANLVEDPVLSATSTLEITTIVAMIAYAIAAWFAGRMIWLLLSRPR